MNNTAYVTIAAYFALMFDLMGCDNASPDHGANLTCGEAQPGLWFGKTDDLWNFGKPSGWGGPWWNTEVKAGEASDPYLMTDFDKKVLFVSSTDTDTVKVTVEVDFQGNGHFHKDTLLEMKDGYGRYVLPDGFSAHWVRLVSDNDATLTAQFHYT